MKTEYAKIGRSWWIFDETGSHRLAKVLGSAVVSPKTVRKRLQAGWKLDDALHVPDVRMLKEHK